MDHRTSSYYPPRAGWSRHWYPLISAVRRQLHLEELNLPRFAIHISLREFLLCIFIPGFSFAHAGWRWLGRVTLAMWFAASGVFLLWLGYAAANIAFAVMMSTHVSSVLHFLNRISPGLGVIRRLGMSVAVLFVLGQLVYATGLRWFQANCFMPLLWENKVYVVNPRAQLNTIERGDLLAVHTELAAHGGVWIREGFTLDKVLAVPGDTVEFTREAVRVNGVPIDRRPNMPPNGYLTLDEKTWLVWPSLTTVTRVNVSQDLVSDAVLQMALVHREQIIGKPYEYWFWRTQIE